MKFKVLFLSLVLSFLFAAGGSAKGTPTVAFNGKDVNLKEPVLIHMDLSFLPIRTFVEDVLGGKVTYTHAKDPVLNIVVKDTDVTFNLASVRNEVRNGTTFLSLRDVSEKLGLQIKFDSAKNKIHLLDTTDMEFVGSQVSVVKVGDVEIPNGFRLREFMQEYPSFKERPDLRRESGEVIFAYNNNPNNYVGYLNKGKVQCRPEMDTEETDCTLIALFTEGENSKPYHIALLLELIGLDYDVEDIKHIDFTLLKDSFANKEIQLFHPIFEGKDIEVLYFPGLKSSMQDIVSKGGLIDRRLEYNMSKNMSELAIAVPSKYLK